MRHHQRTIGFTGVYVKRQAVAATENVVLTDTERQNHFFCGAVTDPQINQTGWLFLDVHVDIDLIGRARSTH